MYQLLIELCFMIPSESFLLGSSFSLFMETCMFSHNQLQDSCLGNSMDRRVAGLQRVHGVAKNQTQLSMHTHPWNEIPQP